MVQKISAYLRVRKLEASIQTATSSLRVIRVWAELCDLISRVLVSLYVNDMPTPSHHVELALYANDIAISATFRSPKATTLNLPHLPTMVADGMEN